MSGNKRICKLADFGYSKFTEDRSASHTKYIGTPGYMAPEVVTGQRYDIKSDIFSLGMIALQIFDTSNYEEEDYDEVNVEKSFSPTITQKIGAWARLISDKLVIASRPRRMTCQEILAQIKKLGINKESIPANELEFFEKKIKENQFQYLSDIISD